LRRETKVRHDKVAMTMGTPEFAVATGSAKFSGMKLLVEHVLVA